MLGGVRVADKITRYKIEIEGKKEIIELREEIEKLGKSAREAAEGIEQLNNSIHLLSCIKN